MKWLIPFALTIAAAALLAAHRSAAAAADASSFPLWQPDYSSDPNAAIDTAPPDPSSSPSILDTMQNAVVSALQLWRPPSQYADLIAQSEAANGIPRDVLARLLYQECRWRADVIDGSTPSPVGALGIAQFMPATAADLGIDPLNPAQAIPAAGRYLASLYRSTGSWAQALAAYNWGIGNVQRKGIGAAPPETRNYYTEILGDVNAADGTAWA